MEIKDILGLVFTLIFLVAFQFLGRYQKKPAQVSREVMPPLPKKKEKMPIKKQAHASLYRPMASSLVKDKEPYVAIKRENRSLGKTLLQDKNSLRKAFICQEILRRPYE